MVLQGQVDSASSLRTFANELRVFSGAMVDADDDLRSVVLGDDGAFAGMAPGAVFVDHTTASAAVARELNALAAGRGLQFVDAPVSGGQAGAVNGALTVMCGGEASVYAKVDPIIAAYAKMQKLLGPAGSGQLTKMVNQICIAGLVEALSEGIHFAKKAGLDVNAVVEVISKGAAGSWQMDNRSKTMLAGKYDFGFAVDWMRKDLGICLEEADRNGARLPITAQSSHSKSTSLEILGKMIVSPGPIIDDVVLRKNSAIKSSLFTTALFALPTRSTISARCA